MERVIRSISLAGLALAALFIGTAAAAPLIRNGSFTEGAGGMPADWHTIAWTPDTARFGWEVSPGSAGTISITNDQPNDARWCQKVAVQPGATYRISTLLKTQEVGTGTVGAHIVIEPRIIYSSDVTGTHDWQRIELVAQAGEESSWEVCARLGSYSNLTTGTAWFRDVTMEQTGRAPARPSRAWLVWQNTRWSVIVLPLLGGLLVLLGLRLGVGRSRPADERDPAGGHDGDDAPL